MSCVDEQRKGDFSECQVANSQISQRKMERCELVHDQRLKIGSEM